MNGVKIIQHNVRNWKSYKITLSNQYNNLDADIILINSHCNVDNEPFKIFNYNTFQCNKNNENHAGAAIAIKKSIKFKLHDDFNTDLLAVTIETLQGPLTVGTAYIPPRQNYLNIIDYHKLLKFNNPVYFIGDLNAVHPSIGNTTANTRGNNLYHLISRGLCYHVGPNFPTYFSHNAATSPDIILRNHLAFYNVLSLPGPLTPSDHIPIIMTISANPIQIPIRPRLHFRKARWKEYKSHLLTVPTPTDPNPTTQEIDQHLQTWTDHITEASARFIPILSHRIIPGIKPNRHTLEIQQTYQHLKFEVLTHGPTLERNRAIIRLQHKLNLAYRTQYNANWDKIMSKLRIDRDPRTFWASIKKFSGNDAQQPTPYLKGDDGSFIHDEKGKEELFREHWSSIYGGADPEINNFSEDFVRNVERTVTNEYQHTISYNTGDLNRLSLQEFPPLTIENLLTAIKRLKHRAPGPSGITAMQIKHLPLNLKNFLLYIYNQCLSAGYFPSRLKLATLVFIPKGTSSQSSVKNFRPISLLEVQAKILDRILKERLYNSLELKNKINPRQHGFREFRGTATALAVFHETIAQKSARRMKIDVALRDVTKAFDKVWHVGLMYKLLQLQLPPPFIRILCSFLRGRAAQIRIGCTIGEPFSLHSGVPQGAVLSPILYGFYTHDLPPPAPNTDFIAYADDITQIISVPRNITDSTRAAIISINEFENQWKIQTNVSKFKIVNINRQKTENIFIQNNHLPYSTSGKVLGLQFSSYGYRSHITTRCSMARAQLKRIMRFKPLNVDIKLRLYKALVRSVLIYPPIPLHTIHRSPMLKLQAVQNKALRFIYDIKWDDFITSESLHLRADLKPINIVLHEQASKTWKTMQLVAPDTIDELLWPANLREHGRWRSSLTRALGPLPAPLYTY